MTVAICSFRKIIWTSITFLLMQKQHHIQKSAINLEPQNKLTVYYTNDQLCSQNIYFFLTISILQNKIFHLLHHQRDTAFLLLKTLLAFPTKQE